MGKFDRSVYVSISRTWKFEKISFWKCGGGVAEVMVPADLGFLCCHYYNQLVSRDWRLQGNHFGIS
ncbi:hypothetical protein MA16_Dca027158 [Dendrobium catenatum]|uniref:Uncharacterized protein n=1 Tax=Dendrobium catenatum TaxID=906689 RepID=A0A2I0VSB8_9ASPA|nr:hypothetical protein MA16_Dca027158 [Dendrobium catenatum]